MQQAVGSKFYQTVQRLLHPAAQALRRHAHRNVVLAGVFVACGMLGIFAHLIWHERVEALANAQQHASNLALVAQRDITRNLELYSLSLQAMVDGYRNPAVMALPEDLRRAALFDRSITARYVSSAVLLDEHGRVQLNLRRNRPAAQDPSDREYFRSHLAQPDDDVHISAPFASRVDSGVTNIALSRRLTHADGSFGGVAVLYLNVDYFRDLLQGLEIGPRGRTSIFGPGGRLLMTMPYVEGIVGEDRSRSPNYRASVRMGDGVFVSTSRLDREERVFVFRSTPAADFKVLVALSLADIYAPWLQRALLVGCAVLAFALLLLASASLLGRELAARLRVEDRLETLANTDGLTGLANRRSLERILSQEAGRARRATGDLGVVFVDVDYFKRYNDSQGHPAGDVVLAAVARVLAESIRRPGDHAGRYGGEEFLAVLAQTSAEGARTVGEKVRQAVEGLALPHPASPLGIVTVSVGVAVMPADGREGVETVVKAADTALYHAKAAGRNRVEMFDARQPALPEAVPA